MPGLDLDVIVVGGGLVGLATARALARQGRSTAVLERNDRVAQETSARHSGVLHAGLYYPAGSLKARLCVKGRRQLVAFCERHGVRHALCGKLIVAVTEAEVPGLERLLARGRANGVEGLRRVTADQVRAREPGVRAVAGLLSEATGIVDSDDLAAALERQVIRAGGTVLTGHAVIGIDRDGHSWVVRVRPARGEEHEVRCATVVNAAGLWAGEVAALAGVHSVPTHRCKGEYFWTTRKVVEGLVYPLPEPGLQGLGVHTTVDLAGRIRFGPDTSWVDDLDYRVDAGKAKRFAGAVSRYLPGLTAADLQPDTAGIRPKLSGDGSWHDFWILEADGLVTLAGVESPGLTSCLALGDEVARRIAG